MGRTRARGALAGVIGLALAAALSGCGDAGGAGDGSGAHSDLVGDDPSGLLDGRTFVASSVDDPTRRLVPGSTVRLAFSGGDVAVDAGCNHLSGRAAVAGDELVVTALGGTEMGCSPALMDQDAWISDFLSGRPRLSASDGTITLARGRTTLRLAEQTAAGDTPLQATRWTLDSLVTGAGAQGSVSSVPAGAGDAVLRVEDGDLRLTAGCTTISARVGVAEPTVDSVEVVARDCEPGQLETHVREVVTDGATYAVDGRRLTVTSRDGTLGLGFVAS